MITNLKCNCKQYAKILIPGKEDTKEIHGWFTTAECPKCHAVGQFHNHGYYSRTVLAVEDGEWVEDNLRILRGYCKSCSSTHAFLPWDLVPYLRVALYSLISVLWVTFFAEGAKTVELRESALPKPESLSYYDVKPRNISICELYRLLARFKGHWKFLTDLFRQLGLWGQGDQPGMKSIITGLLKVDLLSFQAKVLEIHRIPLLFQRSRSATGIPFTGALRNG